MVTITLYLKHADRASIIAEDEQNPRFVPIIEDGYIPYVNPVLGGDDTELKIDNETGMIIGWVPVKFEDNKFIERE